MDNEHHVCRIGVISPSFMKFTTFSLLLLFILSPLSASAATFQGGESVEVESEGNAYAVGSVVQVSKEIPGDVFLAGENVQINERIREDAFIAGKNVTINDPIEDDLHVFGETIVINSDIHGDLIAFGSKVIISPQSRITGEVIIGASMIIVDGRFDEKVRLMGSDVTMNGLFIKDVTLEASHSLDVAETAEIRGNVYVTVSDGMEAVIPEGVVLGEIQREFRAGEENAESALPFLAGFSFFSLLSRILIGALLLALLRPFCVHFGEGLRKEYGKTLGIGFLLLIVPPFAAIFLFFPILTIPLGVLGLLCWGVMLYIASLLSGFVVANLFFPLKKTDSYPLLLGKFALGTLLLLTVKLIPFIGFVAAFAIFLLSIGSFFTHKMETFRTLRKAHLV